MRLRCRRCGFETSEELGFCRNCRTRLLPKSVYDLNLEDYACGPDIDAIETMKATGILPYLLKNLAFEDLDKSLLSRLPGQTRKVTCPSSLDTIVRQCAVSLSIEVLPEVFITEGARLNAFTFGAEERAFVVVDSSFVELLAARELAALFGHELGHVKSGHMLYHTLGEVLSGGISLSASLLGLDILSIPIRLALLSWHRESEVTADRASLLVVDDIGVVKSLMTKLAGLTGRARLPSSNPDIAKSDVGLLESLPELFSTHPLYANRFKQVKEFAESEEFLRARRKIRLRESRLRGLVPVCRFCGASKPAVASFCPRCKRCQT